MNKVKINAIFFGGHQHCTACHCRTMDRYLKTILDSSSSEFSDMFILLNKLLISRTMTKSKIAV